MCLPVTHPRKVLRLVLRKTSSKTGQKTASNAMAMSSSNQKPCPCCSKRNLLWDCSTFARKSLNARLQFMREKRLCDNCAKRGHISKFCYGKVDALNRTVLWNITRYCIKNHPVLLTLISRQIVKYPPKVLARLPNVIPALQKSVITVLLHSTQVMYTSKLFQLGFRLETNLF